MIRGAKHYISSRLFGIIFHLCLLSLISLAVSAENLVKEAVAASPPQVIVIDPGHGGKNTGVVVADHITEKDYVLVLAQDLKKTLMRRSNNIEVFLTRTRDMPVSILERTTLANRKKADVFISIHLSDTSENRGHILRVYINQEVDVKVFSQLWPKKNQNNSNVLPWDLAQNGQRQLSKRLGKILQKVWQGFWPDAGQGLGKSDLLSIPVAVLTGVRAPAVLVELPIPPELDSIDSTSEKYREMVVQILAQGILRFLASR